MRPIISTLFRTAFFIAAIAGTGITAASQQKEGRAMFVDGFHGGVYGHYPLKTYTGYMADQLEKHPGWSICLEIEPETWDSVMVAAPADYLRLREHVKTGRAEFTNPTYAQPYMYNISGESIIRQFEYGIRKTLEYFPEAEFLTYAVEEPCFTSCLPQILKGFGFKYASLKCPNTCWGGYYAPVEGELVNWTGPDGSVILCSPRYSFEELSRQNVFSTNANNNCSEYLGAAEAAGFHHPVGMTYQDAGWTFGPWLESQWKDFGTNEPVTSEYTTWRNYFESVEGEVTPVEYLSDQEDVRPALMWGSQVMQRIGRDVRRAENRIVRAEKMGVMANLDKGYVYSAADIDEGWRTLLLSQHHDSWIVPYNGLKEKGTWADWICGEWTNTTLKMADKTIFEAEYNLGGGRRDTGDYRIMVYNTAGTAGSRVVSVNLPSDWGASGAVLRNADGSIVESCVDFVNGVRKILFRADAPSFGYAAYTLERTEAASQFTRTNRANVIENDMYRITVDPKKGGIVKSITCKKDGNRELVRNGEYSFGELKGYFYDEERYLSSAASRAIVTVVEDNKFEKSMRICGMIGVHPFIETITIRQGDPKIDFSLRIEWQDNPGIGAYRQTDAFASPERSMYDDRYHLNMYFPTTISSAELYKGAPFDVCRSGLDDTNFHNWHNIKHNILLDWVSTEGSDCGMALFSDHTTSYVYGGGRPLALTVQASGNGLWGRDYRIDGSTDIDFAIVPHTGGWRTASEEYGRWNEPMTASIARTPEVGNRSFIDAAGYDITAARIDGTDILVRLFNGRQDNGKRRIKVDRRFSEAVEVDLSGKEVARHNLADSCFEVSIPQFGLKTFILK